MSPVGPVLVFRIFERKKLFPGVPDCDSGDEAWEVRLPHYACIVQEDQAADRSRAALERGLIRLGRETFGDDPESVEIVWRVVRQGYGWTAGEPSTSSIVVRSVPVGLELDRREAFMKKVCDLWADVTGCSIDEIVVTAWDGPLPL